MNRSVQIGQAGRVLALLVLIAVIAPFVVFAVPQVVGADEGFVVLSGSMEPALTPGDVVIVDASAPIRIGDVITYRTSAEAVPRTHRVISISDGGYETKGDANENADPVVIPFESVLGRVTLTIPLVGHVILWTNTPLGYVSLVVVPLVLLALNELLAWMRRRSESEQAEYTERDESEHAERGDGLTAGHFLGAGSALDEPPQMERVQQSPDSAGGEPNKPADRTVAVTVVDLKLTLLATGSLAAYAGWNVYREVLAVAAPNPISVGALTGGLLGLAFAGWVATTSWRAGRTRGATPLSTPAARTDGGDSEVQDE